MSSYSIKFHNDLIVSFFAILLTDKQTQVKTYTLAEAKISR